MMTVPEWREFLQRWSDEWLSTDESFPRQVRKRRWLGFPPATEKQLIQLEKRLNYQLPPSYRNFLLTTNGWSRTSYCIERIRPASKVAWLETENPELVETWESPELSDAMKSLPPEDYYTYDGPSQSVSDSEHLRKSLLIADPIAGDSMIYLLNPLAVAEDGEWEAWRFAHWIPGEERFPSFEPLMQSEHESFLTTCLGRPATGAFNGPFAGPYAPDRPRHAATPIGRQRQKPRRPTIPELITELESPNRAKRLAAANKLFRELGPHEADANHPEIVEPLSRILNSKAEPEVRGAAAAVFGTDGDARAIPPLIDALDNAELTAAALNALSHLSVDLHDSRIGDAMVRLLEQPHDYSVITEAIGILEEL
jgi:hypothetical protein